MCGARRRHQIPPPMKGEGGREGEREERIEICVYRDGVVLMQGDGVRGSATEQRTEPSSGGYYDLQAPAGVEPS